MSADIAEAKVLLQSWVDADLAGRLRARARAADRSTAAELRYVLRQSLGSSGARSSRHRLEQVLEAQNESDPGAQNRGLTKLAGGNSQHEQAYTE